MYTLIELLSVYCNVFCNDNTGKNSKSEIGLIQIQNSTLFREIQTSTVTFIAYLTHFRLISTQSKIPTEFPQAHGDSTQSLYPSHTHTHGNPHGNPHNHGNPAKWPQHCGDLSMPIEKFNFKYATKIGLSKSSNKTTKYLCFKNFIISCNTTGRVDAP